MSDFAALECDLAEAPLFYVEPRDRDPASEHERQCALVKRLRAMGLAVHATPNARAWGQAAWNRAKAEGVEWGASDLTVSAEGGRVAYIETKNGRAMPEQHQVDWLNRRHRMGFPVAVIRTAAGGVAWLKERGFGGAKTAENLAIPGDVCEEEDGPSRCVNSDPSLNIKPGWRPNV